MAQALSVFLLGLSFGFVLFLVATGLSMTMGLMRIVNMAHGALYMLGGFVGLSVTKHSGNFMVGLVAAVACTALLGLILEVGFLRRLYKQEASQVLLTIGFIYILINIAQWIWGPLPLSGVTPSVLSSSVPIGNVDIPVYRLFLIGFGIVMAAALWIFQDKTRIGARVRAGMDSRDTASALGINLRVLFTGIFVLGSLLAGLSGFVGGRVTGVNLNMAWEALLLSLIVVVIGGAGSIQGALLGGIVLGLLNAFGASYFPEFSSYLMYMALIVILLVRPSGLLGRHFADHQASEALERAAAYAPKAAKKTKGADSTRAPEALWESRLKRYLPYALVLIVLVAVPPLVGSYTQSMITKVLIFAIFAMSLDLIMGYTGLLSFGHAAFFALGGYAFGILTVTYGVSSFWLVFPIVLALCAALSAAIGFLSLRVSGVYFLLVTMAFGQLLFAIATKWMGLTGGRDGFPGIQKPDLGFDLSQWTSLKFYFFVFLLFVVCFLILQRITKSAFGKNLVGIRENEPRMRSLGFNTWAAKYVALIIAGVFAGVAGVLYAQSYGTMVPANFALEMSALPMLMVIIGGGGTLWGPVLGAAVIVLVQHYSSIYLSERWPLILGGIFVLSVMFLKGGLARYLEGVWRGVRFSRSRGVEDEQSASTEGRL